MRNYTISVHPSDLMSVCQNTKKKIFLLKVRTVTEINKLLPSHLYKLHSIISQ